MNSQQSKGRPKEPLGETYSEEEAARRRDEALLRALSTPHKLHSEMKLGKGKKPSGIDHKIRPASKGRVHKRRTQT